MDPGELIRATREGQGLSQERLALRAGTKQSAISRLERGQISPSFESLQLLMSAMGQRIELLAKPMSRDYDPLHRQTNVRRSPADRLKLAMSWNHLAGRLAQAGRKGRGGD
ncbi:MAG: helix-turn-helix domain-containing protein [Actinobacteria bacterium]|nr:helix-turn-helix domain-containing protein [Actinomycetota bacterium]